MRALWKNQKMEYLNRLVAKSRQCSLNGAGLEMQIRSANQSMEQVGRNTLPTESETRAFGLKAAQTLHDLNFAQKRAIVLNTVEKIIGSQQQLQVHGYIPLTSYGGYEINDRHRRPTQCWQIDFI